MESVYTRKNPRFWHKILQHAGSRQNAWQNGNSNDTNQLGGPNSSTRVATIRLAGANTASIEDVLTKFELSAHNLHVLGAAVPNVQVSAILAVDAFDLDTELGGEISSRGGRAGSPGTVARTGIGWRGKHRRIPCCSTGSSR